MISEVSSGTKNGRLMPENPKLIKEYYSVKSKDGLTFLMGSLLKDAIKNNEIDSFAKNLMETLEIKNEKDLKNFVAETEFLKTKEGFQPLVDSMLNSLSSNNSVKEGKNVQTSQSKKYTISEAWSVSEEEKRKKLTKEEKRDILSMIGKYNQHGSQLKTDCDYRGLSEMLKKVSKANETILSEDTNDWFDGVTIKRNTINLNKLVDEFEKTARECDIYQQRLTALWDEIGTILGRYYEIENYDETPTNPKISTVSNDISPDEDDYDINYSDDNNEEEFESNDDLLESVIKGVKSKSLFSEAKKKPTEKVIDKQKESISKKILTTIKDSKTKLSGMNKADARKFLKSIGYDDKKIKALEEKCKSEVKK